jgi:phospholipase C
MKAKGLKLTRRDAMKAMGALAGTAAASRVLGGCGGDGGGPGQIDTMVFLMMENRSYDHYLGSRSLEGKPGDGLTAGMQNPDLLGAQVPIWPATNELDYAVMCVEDPPHGWDPSRVQFNGGANDGFVIAYQNSHNGMGTAPMQYMTRDHLPVTHALADAYTTCDRWFCSVLGPTLPNRMYWYAASSNGAKSNDDVIGGAYHGVTSIFHRLDEAGIDWAYYYGDAPVLSLLEGLDLKGRIKRFLYDFIDDAAAGILPPVVYIDPAFGTNDDHPPHHPWLGQMLISATYQALATSPQWPRCQLVITYDEHGGFFDHVAPGLTVDDRAAEGFDQLGFRVPSMVIGPYAKRGHVSSVTYDHTSAIKHIGNTFGLAPLGMRDAAAADLGDCVDQQRLDAGEASDPIMLPAVEIDDLSLPESCHHMPDFTPRVAYDHDILKWVASEPRLRPARPMSSRDIAYGVADYLERHNLGRIRRTR